MQSQTKLEHATEVVEQLAGEDDPSRELWDDAIEAMQEAYGLFELSVTDPRGTERVNYTLWVEDGGDFPVINSQTAGVAGFHSQSTDIGEDNRDTPSEEFFDLVGTGFHEAMSFMPDIYFHSSDKLGSLSEDTRDGETPSVDSRRELRLKEAYTTVGEPDVDGSGQENTHFDNTVDLVYDETPPQHEIWMAMQLIKYMVSSDSEIIPELKPLMLWADNHTEFGMPALSTPAEETTETDDSTSTA